MQLSLITSLLCDNWMLQKVQMLKKWTGLKRETDWKTDLTMNWVISFEKHLCITVALF